MVHVCIMYYYSYTVNELIRKYDKEKGNERIYIVPRKCIRY